MSEWLQEIKVSFEILLRSVIDISVLDGDTNTNDIIKQLAVLIYKLLHQVLFFQDNIIDDPRCLSEV